MFASLRRNLILFWFTNEDVPKKNPNSEIPSAYDFYLKSYMSNVQSVSTNANNKWTAPLCRLKTIEFEVLHNSWVYSVLN